MKTKEKNTVYWGIRNYYLFFIIKKGLKKNSIKKNNNKGYWIGWKYNFWVYCKIIIIDSNMLTKPIFEFVVLIKRLMRHWAVMFTISNLVTRTKKSSNRSNELKWKKKGIYKLSVLINEAISTTINNTLT